MKIKILLIVLAVILSISLGFFGIFMLGTWEEEYRENHWYTTTEISQYGEITHNGNNTVVETFIEQFFPEKIEPYFENVQYTYKARDWCDYCCEMSLEFTIDDHEMFRSYVKRITAGLEGEPFAYDARYQDYIIANELFVDSYDLNENGGYYLDDAKMGRILICDEDQSITYYAIIVTSCCGTNTNNLAFYSRFSVDPLAYSMESKK